MPINSINITQDNTTGQCDLLAISSPLVFLIDVGYSISMPGVLAVDLKDENGDVLGTFQAMIDTIEASNILFRFEASELLSAFMPDLDDYRSELGVIEFVNNMTRVFTLEFYGDSESDSVTFTACNAAVQFSENPALTDLFANNNLTFYSACDDVVYLYWYSASADNEFTVDNPAGENDAYLDYDDYAFLDENDNVFRGL